MDTLAIWGRPPRLDSPVRLSDSPSVCLSACVTDAILCHTYEQSTESRWANKFITCLNALTIHSVRTDVCVCVWCWCGCGHGCLFGVCCVYLLPAQGLPHIFILNLSLSSWQPHKYIHTYTHAHIHSYTVPCSWPTRHWTFLYNSWNAHHSHNRNYDCHSAMCLKVGQDNAYAESTLLVILAV